MGKSIYFIALHHPPKIVHCLLEDKSKLVFSLSQCVSYKINHHGLQTLHDLFHLIQKVTAIGFDKEDDQLVIAMDFNLGFSGSDLNCVETLSQILQKNGFKKIKFHLDGSGGTAVPAEKIIYKDAVYTIEPASAAFAKKDHEHIYSLLRPYVAFLSPKRGRSASSPARCVEESKLSLEVDDVFSPKSALSPEPSPVSSISDISPMSASPLISPTPSPSPPPEIITFEALSPPGSCCPSPSNRK